MFNRFGHHWHRHTLSRRFRRHARRSYYKQRNLNIDVRHLVSPKDIEYVYQHDDFFDCAEEEVTHLLQRRPQIHDLDRDIDRLRRRFETSGLSHDGTVALLAQVPRAVLAQLQMDTFPRGYRNKEERLFELIDFNDTLVDTILGLDDVLRAQFSERVEQAADRICRRVGAPCFSSEQWEAIIRGLTREVAVYLAAKDYGFRAWMTDRAHDALGVDIQIQDPDDGRYINIDVKTPSSFRHRMEELVSEGRLTAHDLYVGDQQSYIIERNGRGTHQVEVIVLCILPDLFGDLANWRFVDAEPMRQKLNQLIRDHGIHDGRYGRPLSV